MDRFEHVVLLMLENHSFDEMLGALQAVVPAIDGVAPGAPPRTNPDPGGRLVAQAEAPRGPRSYQTNPDPKHEHPNVLVQLEGGNQGFVKDYVGTHGAKAGEGGAEVMRYFGLDSLPALHPLARSFVVCDRWFSSLPGPTWPNRCFALSGTSQGRVTMPERFEHLDMLWTQTQPTIFDRLSAKGRSWRVYFYDFPASLLFTHQRRPENLQHYREMTRFFEDARSARSDADFPDFVFLEPRYFGVDQNDDHPPHNVMKAQKLIADVYNAIWGNDVLWRSTLLVVLYDEHGGFYDHVPPPAAAPPDGHREEYTFDRLGVRVPAVLVSPWLEAGVCSEVFDHTSLLAYLIAQWGLDGLGERTSRATSVERAFRFAARLREDTPGPLRVANSDLIAATPEWEQQDASPHHAALHLVADVLHVLEDDAIRDAVLAAAAEARLFEAALPKARAKIGDWLIARGKALRGPLDDARRKRIDDTRQKTRERIGAAQSRAALIPPR